MKYIIFSVILLFSGFSSIKMKKFKESSVELRLLLSVEGRTGVLRPHENLTRDWTIRYERRPLKEGLELLQLPQFRKDLPTMIFIHGYAGSVKRHGECLIAMLLNGYGNRFNIIAPNIRYFGLHKHPPFYRPVESQLVGEAIGELVKKAVQQGLLVAGKVHLMGYSMGAQAAGYIARTVPDVVATIVALDPAGPGFKGKPEDNYRLKSMSKTESLQPVSETDSLQPVYRTDSLQPVSKTDAPIVVAIHTSSRTLGNTMRDATVDILVNGGSYQPRCSQGNLGCSHRRSRRVFAQVVRRPHLFVARNCDSAIRFYRCKCNTGDTYDLSYPPLQPKSEGKYILRTSGKFPYGIGLVGASCRRREEVSIWLWMYKMWRKDAHSPALDKEDDENTDSISGTNLESRTDENDDDSTSVDSIDDSNPKLDNGDSDD